MESTKKRVTRNQLSLFRKRLGLSQKRVTLLMGLRSESRVSDWERGLKPPSLEHAIRLAYILNTPVEFLFADLARALQAEIIMRREQIPGERPAQEGQRSLW